MKSNSANKMEGSSNEKQHRSYFTDNGSDHSGFGRQNRNRGPSPEV